MNRLYNLDYLRGFAASGIMIFHFLTWTMGEYDASTFMGRVGIYGVAIFYVLSGLTLYHVYYHKMLPSGSDLLGFFRKRFFRIFPLLWLATITSIILLKLFPDPIKLTLNLTGLFGFVRWDECYSTGAWSIGNELVFYVFFPFFILFSKKSNIAFILFSLVIFGLFLYFAFHKLNPNINLGDQWKNYVNPLNQVFLFLGGFLIGLIFQKIEIRTWLNLLIFGIGFCLFIFFPTDGNSIHLVTGINRLIFTLSCFLICLSFYKLDIQFPSLFHKPLTLLGEASYSVYLLHPIIFALVGTALTFCAKHFFQVSVPVKFALSIITTLMASYFVYVYFEKFFMKFGKAKRMEK